MNDAVDAAFFFSADWNDESAVADCDDLFLQLRRIRRTANDRFQLLGQARASYRQSAANSSKFRAVPLVDFAILDGAAQMFAEVPEVGQALSGLREFRELLALIFPADSQAFGVGKE